MPQPASLLHVGPGLLQQLLQPCPGTQRPLHLPADEAEPSRAELLQAGSCPLQLLQLPLQGLRHCTLKVTRQKRFRMHPTPLRPGWTPLRSGMQRWRGGCTGAAGSGQSHPRRGGWAEQRAAWFPCSARVSHLPTVGKMSEVLAAGCWHTGADASSPRVPGLRWQRGAEWGRAPLRWKIPSGPLWCAKAYNTWAPGASTSLGRPQSAGTPPHHGHGQPQCSPGLTSISCCRLSKPCSPWRSFSLFTVVKPLSA